MNVTTEEKVKWILENCVTEGGLVDLEGLDFNGRRVCIKNMQAKAILQGRCKAYVIWQEEHEADQIYQYGHKADIIVQNDHNVRCVKPQDLSDYKESDEGISLFERKKIEYTHQQLVRILGHDFNIKEEE